MSEEDEKELSQIAEEKMPRMLGFIDQQMKRVAVRSNLRSMDGGFCKRRLWLY